MAQINLRSLDELAVDELLRRNMTENFDPYQEWLEIDPAEQPPTYYRLLDIPRFEDDPQVIQAAADERMVLLRTFQHGPRGAVTQQLLNQLSTAKLCLLDPAKKKAYDQNLRATDLRQRIDSPGQTAPVSGRTEPLKSVQVETRYLGGHASTLPRAIPLESDERGLPQTGHQAGHQAGNQRGPAPHDTPTPSPIDRMSQTIGVQVSPEDQRKRISTRQTGRWNSMIAAFGGAALVLFVVGGVWSLFEGATLKKRKSRSDEPRSTRDVTGEVEVPQNQSAETLSEPIVVQQEGNGDFHLSPAVAQLEGQSLEVGFSAAHDVLEKWRTVGETARWRFRVVQGGVFQAEVVYRTPASSPGGKYRLGVGDQSHIGDIRTGRRHESFSDQFLLTIDNPGQQTLTLEAVEIPGEELFVLESIRLRRRGE